MKVAPGALRIAFAPRERETVTAAETYIFQAGADAMAVSRRAPQVSAESIRCNTPAPHPGSLDNGNFVNLPHRLAWMRGELVHPSMRLSLSSPEALASTFSQSSSSVLSTLCPRAQRPHLSRGAGGQRVENTDSFIVAMPSARTVHSVQSSTALPVERPIWYSYGDDSAQSVGVGVCRHDQISNGNQSVQQVP